MIKAVGPRPEVNPILAIHSRHFEEGSATTNASNRAGSPCSTAYDSLDDEDLLAAMAGFEIGPCASPNAQPESSCGERSTPNSSQHQPYYISEIPHLNLFVGQLPCKLLLFPYFTLFICLRISIRCRIPMSELMRGMEPNAVAHSPEAFWNSILKNIGGNTDVPQDSAKVWSAASNSFDGFVFKGKISFNTTMTPSQHVFNLEPEVIQSENSCRFERKFGSDRFLYLDCPSFKQKDIKPTRFTWKDMQQIEASWFDWLKKEHSFLGRTWQVIHMEPNDKGKKEELGMRVVMFATKGEGLPTIPRGEMLAWFLPLTENKDQGFCKAFARLDLGFSRTTPTLIFKPSQIRRVPDVRANGEPEDSQFNDTKLNWDERCMEAPVMNDGCSRISVGAAMKVWEEYKTRNKTSNPMPSVFQARIGGAKGLWMISGEPHSKDPRDLEIWIEINDQQLKFKPHPEDLDDQTYDPIRLRFEICGVSSGSAGKAATLHSTFISVLVDRHVPWDSITYIMTKQLDQERRQLIHMIQDNDTGELYRWTRKKISAPQHNGKIQWLASLPQELSRKILLLLECRLCPTESPYLANLIYRYVGQHLTWMEEKIRVPLGRSTYLYVVADPVGALKPGQIYVQFSEPFVDESTGITYRNLHGQDVLVTRHPCGRRSDIQRVQAVNCPALSHLVDVVVFPSRGQYPLAAKLQGGDYDGDQIWICWEDTLVEHFHNAPAPLNPPDPADYGIKKDTRKLCEVISLLEPSNSDTFFEEALKFRSQDSMLGMITNRTEELAYYQNGIHSETYEEFRDIHDLIIDAPKQAFIFTENDFQNLVKKSLKGMILSKPAYKQAMDERQNLKGSHQESRVRRQTNEYNPGNILDFLYFKIVLEHNITTEKAIADALPLEKNDTDPDLQNLCRKLHDEGPAMIRRELIELAKGFHQIIRKWDSGHSTNDNTFDASKKVVEACHKLFLSLLPISQNAALPEIRILQTHFYGPNQPTPWEMIRASAFYTTYPAKSKCVWAMAGKELATLKCGSGEESRLFCDSIAAILVTRRPRAPKAEHVMEEKKSFDEDATPPPIA